MITYHNRSGPVSQSRGGGSLSRSHLSEQKLLALVSRMLVISESSLDATEHKVDQAQKEYSVKKRPEAWFHDSEPQRNDDHKHSGQRPFCARYDLRE